MSNKVIPRAAADYEAWQLPEVGGAAVGAAPVRNGPVLTANQIEEIQRQAYEEGFNQGRADGRAAGRQELTQRVRHLEMLMAALEQPLEQLDEQIEQDLVALALTVARQLVRRELKIDPGQVVATVREALAVLPAGVRHVRLHLHPEDAALVREALAVGSGEQAWQILEDPVLSRGGCRISSDTSQVDATVESRMNAVIAAVLGDERAGTE